MPVFIYTCEVCGTEKRAWRPADRPPRFCSQKCRMKGLAGRPLIRNRKYIITPEMAERIRKVYQGNTGNGEVAALARSLGMPRWRITRYAIEQGWIAKTRKSPNWTEEETAKLQRLARYTPVVIQRKMKEAGYDRSVTAIVLKMRRMRMRKNLDGQSARSVALCLGVDSSVIRRAITSGKLKATRRGTARTEAQGGDCWYIRDRHIRRYIMDYIDEIDLRKVDKYWFVDILARGES